MACRLFLAKPLFDPMQTYFLDRNSLICSWDLPCADKNNSASQTVYTYKTHDSHTSCIDHFMISSAHTYSARSVAVLDYTACSKDYGHFPICINFTLSTPRENDYYCNDDKCVSEKIAWHKVTNFTDYQSLMSEMLSVNTVIGELSCLRCNDVNCENPIHLYEIDLLCSMLTDMCITAADATLPKVGAKCKFPGWLKEVQPLKNVAAFLGAIWKENGRPHTGIVSDIYMRCRHEYHYTIRFIKKKGKCC